MYDYLDRRVGSLDDGSQFLVWAMRGWTNSMAGRRCPPAVLEPGFARVDLAAMLPHFHMAMMTLNRDGLVKMGFGAVDCSYVSEAEAILLSTLMLYATNRFEQANATVEMLVGKDGVMFLRRALTAIAIMTHARFPLDPAGPATDSITRHNRDSRPNSGIINGIDGGVDGE